MDLTCDELGSDSPYIETIWRSRSEDAGSFVSMAQSHYGLVVTKYRGKTWMTVRGPETSATPARGLKGAEFYGILFKPGVFMPMLPPRMVLDRHDLDLPAASSKGFWLNGSAWEYPRFDAVDTFVDRLVRDGILVRDPLVAEVLRGHPVELDERTVQRRFRVATGLTRSSLLQIERARYAVGPLKQGAPILDVVAQAGYFDQPHMTRALKHFAGLTPAQIMDRDRPQRLSFLYKTADPAGANLRAQG